MVASAIFVVLLVVPAAAPPGVVARAEKTDLRHSDGSAVARVQRDRDGNVTEMLLNDMRLTPAEVADLERLTELRRLVLFRTNFGDGDLKRLAKCTHLESLNLSGTDVSDDTVAGLLEFKSLKYLCLGGVKMSPDAVAKLNEQFRARGQDVRLGYSRAIGDRYADRQRRVTTEPRPPRLSSPVARLTGTINPPPTPRPTMPRSRPVRYGLLAAALALAAVGVFRAQRGESAPSPAAGHEAAKVADLKPAVSLPISPGGPVQQRRRLLHPVGRGRGRRPRRSDLPRAGHQRPAQEDGPARPVARRPRRRRHLRQPRPDRPDARRRSPST